VLAESCSVKAMTLPSPEAKPSRLNTTLCVAAGELNVSVLWKLLNGSCRRNTLAVPVVPESAFDSTIQPPLQVLVALHVVAVFDAAGQIVTFSPSLTAS